MPRALALGIKRGLGVLVYRTLFRYNVRGRTKDFPVSRTPTFICEVPLRVSAQQAYVLNTRLEAARQIYNACLGKALKRAHLMREGRRYRTALQLPRGKERSELFHTARTSVGFTDAALQRSGVVLRRQAFMEHLDVHVTQKLASRAFAATLEYLRGKRGRPRFKGYGQLDTVEGKSNYAGIRWRGGYVEWKGLTLPALLEPDDAVIAHALSCRIKYVRVVRRKVRGRERFYGQLVCEGLPCRKPWHTIGAGEVGLDLGPSTVAAVGEDTALLVPLCEEVVRAHRTIRARQRKLDRQRRANSPANYLPDGRVKTGPKRWQKSHRQQQIEAELAELLRREAAHRKTLHGQLANRILAMGKVIMLEDVSYRAFQRQYGRSTSVRAPGTFVATLCRKAESAGGRVVAFSGRKTKLSQICHYCGLSRKKPLAQRVHACDCGLTMQRDLYSAFLAWCVSEDGLLHADLARERWAGAEPLLRAAWSRALQPANGRLIAVLLRGCASESERVARAREDSQG